MRRAIYVFILSGVVLGVLHASAYAKDDLPSLRPQGTATQLLVEGQPFLMLGGELGNSSASSLEYMVPVWETLEAMGLNTVLAPVYWDLLEPSEGAFDFELVDGLIAQARDHDLKLVLLWFGSWKNSMSCYTPGWVKRDTERFERARLKNGEAVEILSAFSKVNLEADKRAFAALMRHLRETDSDEQTVILVQVENEIGMLGDAREYGVAANEAFAGAAATELIAYLDAHKDSLHPALAQRWKKNGYKTSGSWQEVFGKGLATDEIFMAWFYGRYAEQVAAAGKAEYALPMYVNAALNRPKHKPGEYPSAGPLPHLADVWRAAAPSIDFLSPDIYFPDAGKWIDKYRQPGNAMFVPEIKLGTDNGAQAFYVVGECGGMGFSPFSIESTAHPESCSLSQSYDILGQLRPLIFVHQGVGTMRGVLLDKAHPVETIKLGEYVLTVSHDYTWGWSGGDVEAETWPAMGGLIIAEGPGRYVIAGSGLIVTFACEDSRRKAGILSIQEGEFEDGDWVGGRWLSGDQSHQGRHLRLPSGQFGIQKVTLYPYK